jgi:hypothetical protein
MLHFGAVLRPLQPYLNTKAEEALQKTHNRGSNRDNPLVKLNTKGKL